MLKDNDLVLVRNRNIGTTGYILEDGGHRRFEIGEVKKIPFKELKALSYSYGGRGILQDCLVVEDQNALEFLNLNVEPEYFYSEEDIKKVLLEGTLDQLEDTLNFAPEGVIEIIKKMAVDFEVPDTRKRDMISKKTGFNINSAIMINKQLAEGEEEQKEEQKPVRKSTPINAGSGSSPQRKAAIPAKYNVVKKG